jgi:hypothetical protein
VLSHVVRALASTTEPGARRLLAEIAERFPDRDYGRLAGLGPAAAPPPDVAESDEGEPFVPAPAPAAIGRPKASLSGDLEVFGLPGLLQSLQQSEASGRLVLRTATGQDRAVLELVDGRLAHSRCGKLAGDAAFYQIFEVPVPGTFEFLRDTGASVGNRPRGAEILGLLMEAMRRFDEFQRLRALLPDEARLGPGSGRPTAPPGEQDGELVRRLWTRVREGATVAELDEASEVDAFRARALAVHWLEEGAVRFLDSPRAAAGGGGHRAS